MMTKPEIILEESPENLLRKTFISSQNIPYFANWSFYCNTSNNATMNTSIFLHPKINLSKELPKQYSFTGKGKSQYTVY